MSFKCVGNYLLPNIQDRDILITNIYQLMTFKAENNIISPNFINYEPDTLTCNIIIICNITIYSVDINYTFIIINYYDYQFYEHLTNKYSTL